MRFLNLIILLFPIFTSFSLNCQQDRPDFDLQTVYKILRTPDFNQALKSYKKDSSKTNPYDQLVDNLMQKNSSVATYVKNITKNMRNNALEKIELKDLFYEYKQHKSHLLNVLNKYSDRPSELFLEKTNYKSGKN